jgi:hypothetical protein
MTLLLLRERASESMCRVTGLSAALTRDSASPGGPPAPVYLATPTEERGDAPSGTAGEQDRGGPPGPMVQSGGAEGVRLTACQILGGLALISD